MSRTNVQTHGRSGPRRALTILIGALSACSDDILPPSGRDPIVASMTVAANPSNVLSAVVSVRATDADSVAVMFHVAGRAGADSTTPAMDLAGDSASIPVLGLLPGTSYAMVAVAHGRGAMAAGDSFVFTTGDLPADLPSYTAGGPEPSPGYVVFAAGRYGLVIDNTGRVVWYRRFDPNGPFLNFQAQPNGRYVGLPVTPDPADLEAFMEVDVLGNVTRTLGCAGGLVTRFHDLIALADGSWWIMCDEQRTMDLTGVGGVASARVTGTVVQHVAADGRLLFAWSPFDHFAITDLDSVSRSGPAVNWTHGNALDLDAEGNLIVSFRSLSEITRISTATGAVMWRMGGLRNQFTFLNAPSPSFARQHGVRPTGPGQLLLLDNLGDITASFAERYAYDEVARTAQLVRSYGSNPGVTAILGGTAQHLESGHALVAFGNGRRVEEYDASGAVVWRIEGDPGYVFRAQRIRSLYRPGIGVSR